MKALKIDIAGKPTLYVPLYDLGTILVWLASVLDTSTFEVTIKTVEL